ncbi:leucine-rich repeat domain-containing protein [Ruminococcus sp.]|uniref:leucine-rich repeat domain-containing protein n=1 Tax=Ruminococcus sp. TaxID=41978 RepID=UPI0025F7448E|nr:leucine-rich repeat domain-containing protein [Ruminococcus sp.]MBQ8967033.1 leucine-rich repeat domain-containing protein [Ruminococcus sp.]
MREYTDFDGLKKYIPVMSDTEVHRVGLNRLSCGQAAEQGWHYRRKSKKRMRITGYTGTSEEVTIPAEIGGFAVNDIGSLAFAGSSVKSIAVPETVKKLGAGCFANSRLESIVFANGVKDIPERAFADCRCLKQAELPFTLKTIGREAFAGCSALSHIDIPRFCLTVSERAFARTRLSSFTLPVSPHLMDGTAFEDTPLEDNFDIIASRLDNCIRILRLSPSRSCPRIRSPKGTTIVFGRNSIPADISFDLDLRECRYVEIDRHSFGYKRWLAYANILLPQGHRPVRLPEYVTTNRYDKRLFCLRKARVPVIETTLPVAVLNERCIDNLFLRELRLNAVALPDEDDEPMEIFGKICYSLEKVSWVEGGRRYTKYIPDCGLDIEQKRSLLKAFVLKRTDNGCTLFDRSVVDRFFANIPQKDKPKLSLLERTIIALDVLRSDPKEDEDSLDIYTRFLDGKKIKILKKAHNLPEKYAALLQKYYSGEKLS